MTLTEQNRGKMMKIVSTEGNGDAITAARAISDALYRDRVALRAVLLAARGLGETGPDQWDVDAFTSLLDLLQVRLGDRHEQMDLLLYKLNGGAE